MISCDGHEFEQVNHAVHVACGNNGVAEAVVIAHQDPTVWDRDNLVEGQSIKRVVTNAHRGPAVWVSDSTGKDCPDTLGQARHSPEYAVMIKLCVTILGNALIYPYSRDQLIDHLPNPYHLKISYSRHSSSAKSQ